MKYVITLDPVADFDATLKSIVTTFGAVCHSRKAAVTVYAKDGEIYSVHTAVEVNGTVYDSRGYYTITVNMDYTVDFSEKEEADL